MKNTIIINGKGFTTRTLFVHSEETGNIAITIASESLQNELANWDDDTAEYVDNSIYFYVDNDVLELPANIICKKHLDLSFTFLKELIPSF